jgi:hypothetical protein
MYVLAMKLVLLAALIGSLGPGLGCSHEAKPVVVPDEHPPLPPASGSPIGHLVDDAGELKLRDDQLTKLRAIDDELGARLAAYETELRTGEPLPDDNHPDAQGVAFHVGGSHDPTGPAGGEAVRPVGGGATGYTGDRDNPTKRYVIRGETLDRIYRQRTGDTREAIRRALALLDAAQRTIARRVLTEHGVDPDTGETTGGDPGARPAGGDPAPNQPGEP